MLDDNQILIKDSCILFDLLDLGLLKEFFSLKYEIYTTLYVVSEVTSKSQLDEINQYITAGRLKIDSDGSFETIQTFLENHPGLSLTDCSILELAIRRDGIILSADKTLRNIATRKHLNVRGMIWVIDLLVEGNVITAKEALEKLKVYPEVNQRVPIKELNEYCTKLAGR